MAQNEAAAFMERCAGDEGFRAAAYQTDGPEGFLAWAKRVHGRADDVRLFVAQLVRIVGELVLVSYNFV